MEPIDLHLGWHQESGTDFEERQIYDSEREYWAEDTGYCSMHVNSRPLNGLRRGDVYPLMSMYF